MKRRDFLHSSLSAVLSLYGLKAFAQNHAMHMIELNKNLYVDSISKLYLDALKQARRPRLPIPSILSPNHQGEFVLKMQKGVSTWLNHTKLATYGFNGAYLSPVLRAKSADRITVRINNQLDIPSNIHWHGFLIPGQVDGGPDDMLQPQAQRVVRFTVAQSAATLWFHPHPHQYTGYQVAKGLAGMFIIDDEFSLRSTLPQTWGVNDIALILQDKRLNAHGQIDYEAGNLSAMDAAMGHLGNILLSNACVYPEHQAPLGWLRIRLLNGCNARALTLARSDKKDFYVIASDGGFLAQPQKLQVLELLPGERFEIMLQTTPEGFDLVSIAQSLMSVSVPPFNQDLPVLRIKGIEGESNQSVLPDDLVALEKIDSTSLPVHEFQLSMDPQLDQQGMQAYAMQDHRGAKSMNEMSHESMADMHHMHGAGHDSDETLANQALTKKQIYMANKINGQAFVMGKATFALKQGQWMKWRISGRGDMMAHPFHIHGTQFRILSENGQAVAAHRQGLKDIVNINGGVSEIAVKFDHLADAKTPYMAHCHNLEHEDTGMMMAFTTHA